MQIIDPAHFDADAEIMLNKTIEKAATDIVPLIENRNYVAALRLLASLREPVDDFFERVMVMAEDLAKRNNRLALLSRLRNLFLQVADISLLQFKSDVAP